MVEGSYILSPSYHTRPEKQFPFCTWSHSCCLATLLQRTQFLLALCHCVTSCRRLHAELYLRTISPRVLQEGCKYRMWHAAFTMNFRTVWTIALLSQKVAAQAVILVIYIWFESEGSRKFATEAAKLSDDFVSQKGRRKICTAPVCQWASTVRQFARKSMPKGNSQSLSILALWFFHQLQLLKWTAFPSDFTSNERFCWIFCMGGSWLPSFCGKNKPRLKTSTAASCTFSQPWNRPRWLNAPTALGKAWWRSWKSISLKRCRPPRRKAMTCDSTG